MADTFLVRIFIFGLVAFAKGEHDAKVLVLRQDVPRHIPYVAFDPQSCGRKCPGLIRLFHHNVKGFYLNGNSILLDPITDPKQHKLLFAGGRAAKNPPPVPSTSTEAADFSWVASLPTILAKAQNGDGKVHDDCLNNPVQCPHTLAAQMNLTLGSLQTCYLISKILIFPFDFKENFSKQGVHQQAIASVVGLTQEISGRQFVTLKLADLGGKPTGQEVNLFPKPCKEGPADKECIDIFLGNLRDEDQNDITGEEIAPHFGLYYELLAKQSKSFIPQRQSQPSASAKVEPVCRRELLGVGSVAEALVKPAASVGMVPSEKPSPAAPQGASARPAIAAGSPALGPKRAKAIALLVPYSKPLCPPAVLAKP